MKYGEVINQHWSFIHSHWIPSLHPHSSPSSSSQVSVSNIASDVHEWKRASFARTNPFSLDKYLLLAFHPFHPSISFIPFFCSLSTCFARKTIKTARRRERSWMVELNCILHDALSFSAVSRRGIFLSSAPEILDSLVMGWCQCIHNALPCLRHLSCRD